LFTLGNVGDVALRAVVDAILFGQTSFAGSFFIPPGLTMPYMVAIDSGQLPVGVYQQTITLRTSDAQWSLLTVTLKATITASPVGGALAYIIDPYKPLTTGLYVQGPQTRKAVVKYSEAVAVDAAKVHPLVVRDDLSDQTLGLGRKIASNPSAYGYDPALVGLGMQGAMVGQGISQSQLIDVTPTPTVTNKATPNPPMTTLNPLEGCYWKSADGKSHRYELVNQGKSWFDALADARQRSLGGVSGYLATITSSVEQDCLYQMVAARPVNQQNYWIAGAD
jgi:hypothetical protein